MYKKLLLNEKFLIIKLNIIIKCLTYILLKKSEINMKLFKKKKKMLLKLKIN